MTQQKEKSYKMEDIIDKILEECQKLDSWPRPVSTQGWTLILQSRLIDLCECIQDNKKPEAEHALIRLIAMGIVTVDEMKDEA